MLSAVACHRQQLVDPYKTLAHVPVSTDWSESELEMSKVGNVSIHFYPKNGGEPVVKISDNLNFNLVELPIGEYSVLIFNDMVDNIKGVNFVSPLSYQDFGVSTIENRALAPTFYKYDPQNEMVATIHDRVASWYLDSFTVDESMIEYTRSADFNDYIVDVRSRSESRGDYSRAGESTTEAPLSRVELPASSMTRALTKSLEELSNVVVPPITTVLNIDVRVINLNNAYKIETILKGMASGYYLTQQKELSLSSREQLYNMETPKRVYDDPNKGIDGNLRYTHNTFGRTTNDESYTLYFEIISHSGKLYEFERDITEEIKTSADSNHTIEIDLVLDDELLELDPYEEPDFGVDDWEDKETVYL